MYLPGNSSGQGFGNPVPFKKSDRVIRPRDACTREARLCRSTKSSQLEAASRVVQKRACEATAACVYAVCPVDNAGGAQAFAHQGQDVWIVEFFVPQPLEGIELVW